MMGTLLLQALAYVPRRDHLIGMVVGFDGGRTMPAL